MATLAALLSGGGATSADPATYRRRLAAMLMQQGLETSPVQHWTQGAARMANALVGGQMMGQLREEDLAKEGQKTEGQRAIAEAMLGMSGGGAPTAAPTAPVMQPQRPPTPSTSRVIGDDEGMKLGLYERGPDGRAVVQTDGVGPRPVNFNDRFAAATPPPVTSGQAPPMQSPQPQPANLPPIPQGSQIPAQIQGMLRSNNPYVRQFGIDLASKLQQGRRMG